MPLVESRRARTAVYCQLDGRGWRRTTVHARVPENHFQTRAGRSRARGASTDPGPNAELLRRLSQAPHAIAGGGGDFATNVFVQAERFDFVTFDRPMPWSREDRWTRRSVRQRCKGWQHAIHSGAVWRRVSRDVARQMTQDMQAVRDSMLPGQSKPLVSKGVSFGVLAGRADGAWEPPRSKGFRPRACSCPGPRPSPVWQYDLGTSPEAASSLREFTNTAYNVIMVSRRPSDSESAQSHGDGVSNEMTRGDVTAVVAFSPRCRSRSGYSERWRDRTGCARRRARVRTIRCTECHVASLPLERRGWTYRNLARSTWRGIFAIRARLLEIDGCSESAFASAAAR